ncbi:portal protein [Nocardia phage P3.1]|nr:portal protein [Nocardia phage P3.1]
MYTTKKQFSSIKPWFSGGAELAAASAEDQERLQAYEAYEDFYYNRPESLKLTIRGDSEPLYLPSSRKIIEAKNRFLAKNYNFMISPGKGDKAAQAQLKMYLDNLWRREEIAAKFASNRRMGLIRGDAVWHITADPTKPQGKRLSVHAVHPGGYFPIEDPNSPGRIIGVHLVDRVQDPRESDNKEKLVARRQTYRRVLDANGVPTGVVTSELGLYETDGWDDRFLKPEEIKPVQVLRPVFNLPPQVTTIPVYHIRNRSLDSVIFGLSELSGVETLLSGMNQSLTDEDLTLVIQGLGMYMTTAGPPKNPDGSPAPWNLGPGQVVEVGEDQKFDRVSGVSSVAPMQDHIKYMDDYISQGLGVPEIASGRVDVAVAESGISLKLQMAPLLADAEEKQLELLGRMDQMWYDITTMWLPAYESMSFEGVEVVSTVDDPMPVNRDQQIQEILLLQSGGLITIAMAQAKLSKLGYDFMEGDEQKVVEEAQALAKARNGDEFENRWGEETEPEATGTGGAVGQAADVAAPSPTSVNGAAL